MSEQMEGDDLNQAIRPNRPDEEKIPTVALTTVIAVAAVGLLALVIEVNRMILRRRTEEPDD
jgi:DUF1009 family protein